MPQTYTIISFDGGNPLRCTMRRIGSIETHVHEFFELDMLLSGSCQVSSGSEVFNILTMRSWISFLSMVIPLFCYLTVSRSA